jgi:hypothetical protein
MDASGLKFPDLDHERIAAAGAVPILEGSKARAPEAPKDATDPEQSHLRDTARIDRSRGGDSTVGVVFDSVYAAYIHENLGFAHPHGGQAKYLEASLREDKDKALRAMAEAVLS